MNFQDTLEYMYRLLPMYQRVGKTAFKKDLSNTLLICEKLGNPQEKFKSIHIAGTNGKGSSAHMLASILQTAGYKTGLYTSPHLKSFTERIKINGYEVEEDFVVAFIENIKDVIHEIQPSFFEVTVAMAFDYFAKQHVDIAIIEVGLGGRFDSTNVIVPIISLITSIGLDHTDMLGETLPEIAFEKAGIIKQNVPVVIGEIQSETAPVFKKKASEMAAPIYFAEEEITVANAHPDKLNLRFDVELKQRKFHAETDLGGEYQLKNIPGVVKVIELMHEHQFLIDENHLMAGLRNVVKNTGLLGRWQTLSENPLTICDTVHNEAGVRFLMEQIRHMKYRNLHLIWGVVEGKDLQGILKQLPKDAFYYFCEAKLPRAMDGSKLRDYAIEMGLSGEYIADVNRAIEKARMKANPEDLIIIGGSNFIIAEINDLKS